ncbi:hypothetical protein F2Q69_00049377 [Brassica cretica]|uniref:Uncharacterized protein n=1 Tax=Brassica cretica TaxID=69181 RepID=A0A8S9PP59_BRACR|nr:hypothetical protein F2Q69_00049377 [Brassica cretica]
MEMDTRMGNMFTELNNKYDTLTIHIRKIDVQLAQTAESVKRQQGTLPGKTDKNPRTEHCNAIEQPFTETAPGAEERAEQPTSSAVTAPDEFAETPPSRVYWIFEFRLADFAPSVTKSLSHATELELSSFPITLDLLFYEYNSFSSLYVLGESFSNVKKD